MKRAYRPGMVLCAALILGCPTLLAAITDADRAAARATVEQTYGRQIRQVKATPEKQDDLTVAQQLLDASATASGGNAVRAELARTAMDLAAAAAADQSDALATRALEQWATVGQVSKVERANALAGVLQTELDARPDRRKELTARLAEAVGELAQAYEAADDLDAAAAQIGRAVGLAGSVAGLTDTADDLNLINQRIQRARAFKRDLAAAQQELVAGVAGNNPPAVKAANEKIGLLYLLRKGDPVGGASFLTKAGHEWAPQAELLARRAAGTKLSPEQDVAAGEMLRSAVATAEIGAKAALLELVLELCAQADAGLKPGSELAARVETLRQQAKAMLEKLPLPKSNPLRKALASLVGTVQFNPDGTVQVTYSFTTPEQLRDWTIGGQWTVAGGRLSAQTPNGYVYSNLRLRADRPVQITFTTSGSGAGALVLALNDAIANYNENPHFTLYAPDMRWTLSGQGVNRAGGQANIKQPVAFQVVGDGTAFNFTLNGQAVTKLQPGVPLAGASLRVGLDLRRGGQFIYGTLVIRGTPVSTDPVAKSAATVTPQPTPPAQPPPPGPGRFRRGGGPPWQRPGDTGRPNQ